MNYQDEYYKEIHIQNSTRNLVFGELERINRIKYNDNGGKTESKEDRNIRISWYYDIRIDIESSSIQELYRKYINNRNFSDRRLSDTIRRMRYRTDFGTIKALKKEFADLWCGKSFTFKDDESFSYNSCSDLYDHFIAEIRESLLNLNKEDRIIYCKYILTEISNMLDCCGDSSLKNFTEDQTKKIRLSVIYGYLRFFNELKQMLYIFNINIDSLIGELELGEKLYKGKQPYNKIYKNDDIPILDKENRDEVEDIVVIRKNYKNKAYTAVRQVLAIETLLSELNVDTLNTNKTDIASFMQFLTGRQCDSAAKDTTLYKLIDAEAKKGDYIFVAKEFESLGLDKIAQKLKNAKDD